MKGQPDDPSNPNRARPPKIEKNPENGAIKRMVDHFDQTVGPFLKQGTELSNSMREFLAYAFIAETGLKATECCLVSKPRSGGGMSWHYERHYSTDPVARKNMEAMEVEIKYLRKQLRDLTEGTDA